MVARLSAYLFRAPAFFHLCDFVLFVHKDDRRTHFRRFCRRNPRLAENDDLIALLKESRRRAIQNNIPFSFLPFQYVGAPRDSI